MGVVFKTSLGPGFSHGWVILSGWVNLGKIF